MSGRSEARARWESLPADPPREQWFEALHDVLAESYLADPADPYRMSGKSGGAPSWEAKRRVIADAVHKSGDFIDLGCANGLLLESLIGWAAERGHSLRPHGVDFIAELIRYARARHPGHESSFEVANVYDWRPRRRYDFVRVGVECVPPADRVALLRRLWEEAVAPGGRLIACYYRDRGAPDADLHALVEQAGLSPAGEARVPPSVALVWSERPSR